jgi:hypothetical protein
MWDEGADKARLQDEEALSTLAVSTLAALYEAGLTVEMELVRARVLSRNSLLLFDQVRGDDGKWHLVYKPMVELLLLHVRDAAVSDGPCDERRDDILWALETAGF